MIVVAFFPRGRIPGRQLRRPGVGPDRLEVLRDRAAAEDTWAGMAVVEVEAGVPLPCPAVGIEVGLARPRPFRKEDAVVFEQRTLAIVELRDGAGVIHDRAGVGTLRLGPPPLGVEQLVECHRAGIVGSLHRLHLPFGGDAAVEVCLGEREIRVDVPHCLDQRVRCLEFLVLQSGPLAGQLQLVVPHRGEFATEAERHQELSARLPFLKLSTEERRIGVGAPQRIVVVRLVRVVVLVDEVLSHAEKPPATHEVEPGQDHVLSRREFQLLLLDHPLLLAEFRRPRQSLDQGLLPIERDAGGGRLVRRPDQSAVAGRDTHHVPKPVFAAVDVGERLLHLAAEEEILLAGLGLLVGLTAAGLLDIEGMDLPPGFERAVAACLTGFEVAVGEVELPVRLLGVADEISDARLELSQRDVGVDAGEQHAAEERPTVDIVERIGTGDPVVGDASPLQERLAEREVVVRRPGRRHLTGFHIVVVIERRVLEAEGRTGGGLLLDPGRPVAGVALEVLRENDVDRRLEVLRPVDPVPRERTGDLRVEEGQGAFNAAKRIGLGDRRVVDARRDLRIGQQRDGGLTGLRAGTAEALKPASEVAEHLAVFERRADRLLERQLPDLVEAGVGERERFGCARRLVERRFATVGILELLDRAYVVRQITVLEKVERLLRRTAAHEERDARQGSPELFSCSRHGGLPQGGDTGSNTLQIAVAAPKGLSHTICATRPGTVPPDSVPATRAPRRSDGSGDIGSSGPQTWKNRHILRRPHNRAISLGL